MNRVATTCVYLKISVTNMLLLYIPLLNLCASGFFSSRGSPVEELTSDSAIQLTAAVRNSGNPEPLILLQYSHYCGHCVTAAPKFLALAQKFREFKFAAIDCLTLPNDFCNSNDFAVRAVPTLRIISRTKIDELDREQMFGDASVLYLQQQLAPFGATPRDDLNLQVVPMIFPPSVRWEREHAASSIVRRDEAAEAVRVILRLQIPKLSQIPDSTVTDARNFLNVIASSFPLRTLRDDALKVLAAIPASPVTADAWHAILDNTFSFPQGPAAFRFCGDFSCGLWQLFHLFSVSAGRTWAEKSANSPGEILAFTRATVLNFFDCDACKNHFIAAFDSAELERPNLDSTNRSAVMMWLWRFHNSVTARVAYERGWVLDTQWPSACGTCDAEPVLLTQYWDDVWLGVNDITQTSTIAPDTTTDGVQQLQSQSASAAWRNDFVFPLVAIALFAIA